MTDPAVEAARKAWNGTGVYRTIAENAAREALRPIREEWAELSEAATNLSEYGSYLESAKAAGMREVLAVLAPLIYPTEELER